MNLNQLRILGVVTMVCDHVGAFVLQEQPAWRLVGRLCFPIFAYLIAEGTTRSRDRWAYAERLLYWGLATVPIHWAVVGVGKLNILFTLSAAVVLVTLLQQRRPAWQVIAFAGLCATLPLPYGLPGCLCAVAFTLRGLGSWVWLLQGAVCWFAGDLGLLLGFAVVAVMSETCLRPWWKVQRFNLFRRWCWYAFYPLHFVPFYFLK